MPIFQLLENKIYQLQPAKNGFRLESDLHYFFEQHLFELLGVQLLAREYSISGQAGRIDTLGLDENYRPVIIEYKLDTAKDEVLAQGMFYQKALRNNKAHFELLVKHLRNDVTKVDWQTVRLILIAQAFEHKLRSVAEDFDSIDLSNQWC
jgi:RecB family endonuclease NucS